MADPTFADSYFGDSIVIGAGQLNQPLSLMSLVQAVAPNIVSSPSKLTIQADSANASPVLLGSSRISATNYGASLVAGASSTYQNGVGVPAPFGKIFLWFTAASTIHVEVAA